MNVKSEVRDLAYAIEIGSIGRDHRGRICVEVIVSRNGGAAVRRTVSLSDLNGKADQVIDLAGEAGIALVSPGSKGAFLRTVQSKIDEVVNLSGRNDVVVASRVGWCSDGFVLPPDRVYAFGKCRVVPALSGIDRPHRWDTSKNIDDWHAIARKVIGNSLFMFAGCVAATGPLLGLMNFESFGFMLFATSSIGKSTVSQFVASFWGGEPGNPRGFMDSLYTTPAKMEDLAAQTRDCCLVLDDTKSAVGGAGSKGGAANFAEAIFTLAEGVAKGRKTDIASPETWRVVFWATSNATTEQILSASNHPYDPSYGVRLIEISAERQYGVFDVLPDGMSAAQFVGWLQLNCAEAYGTAAHRYLRYLAKKMRKKDQLLDWLRSRMDYMKTRLKCDPNDGTQVRICDKFALVYAAGALASKAKVLPWTRQEIRDAIFKVYRAHRKQERKSAAAQDPVTQLRDVLRRRYAELVDVTAGGAQSGLDVDSAFGFVTRTKGGKKEYAFRPSKLEGLVGGSGRTSAALKALKKVNLLVHDQGGKKASQKNQTKRQLLAPSPKCDGRFRVYCIRGAILDHG